MNDKLPKDQLELQDRIAALEQKIEVQKFTTQRLIASYDQRLAALEDQSDAARQQGFTPGWVRNNIDDVNRIQLGVCPNGCLRNVYLTHSWGEGKAYLTVNGEEVKLFRNQLENLIGAALTVLKRMEDSPDAG